MEKNQWERTPYEKEIAILEKWNERVGFPLTWKQATVCEYFDNYYWEGDYIAGKIEAPESPINGLSRLHDMVAAFKAKDYVENELIRRKENSPCWEEGRKLYLKELEEYIQTPDEFEPTTQEWKMGRAGLEHTGKVFRPSVQMIAYQDMILGNIEKPLFQYADHLSPAEFLEPMPVAIRVDVIKDIAIGAALVEVIHGLKAEIEGQKYEERPESSRKDRLKWIGTQGELGAIVDKLMEQGYIENNQEASKTARLAMASFSFTGGAPSEMAFRQCFKNGNSKEPIRLTIPPSNNKGVK